MQLAVILGNRLSLGDVVELRKRCNDAERFSILMIRQFFAYYRPYQGLFYLDFGCAVIVGLLELGFPLAINQFVDNLLPSKNWPLIILATVVLLGIYALNTGLQYVVTYWGHMLGINIETDMRTKLFDHIQKLSFRYFDNNKTGHLIARITTDLQDIGEMAHHGPEDLFIAIMTLLGAFVLMAMIHPELALLTFVVVPLILWVAVYFSGKMTLTFRQLFRSVGQFNARIEDALGGVRVVKAFANEDHERELFAINNNLYRQTKLTAYKLMAKGFSLSYMLMRFVILFVMVAGTWYVIQGELTYGQFIAYLLLTNVFFRPIEKINAVIESYPRGIAGFKQYLEILNTAPDIEDAPEAVAVDHLEGNIRFEQVTFGYEAGKTVLRDLDLSIRAGTTVAFVGPSGGGKTTLCSLIPRFYEVAAGRITIDGIDIRTMTRASLRRQIGIVQQDVFLFSGTIGENIAYGKLEAGEDEIWAAASRPSLMSSSAASPTVWRPSSASGASSSPAGRSSGWPLPACFSKTRPSSFWMKPPPPWTQPPKWPFSKPWSTYPGGGPPSSSPIAWPPSRMRIASSW